MFHHAHRAKSTPRVVPVLSAAEFIPRLVLLRIALMTGLGRGAFEVCCGRRVAEWAPGGRVESMGTARSAGVGNMPNEANFPARSPGAERRGTSNEPNLRRFLAENEGGAGNEANLCGAAAGIGDWGLPIGDSRQRMRGMSNKANWATTAHSPQRHGDHRRVRKRNCKKELDLMFYALCGSVVHNRAGETSGRSSGARNVKRTQLGGRDNRRARPALRDGRRDAGRSAGGPVAGEGEPGIADKANRAAGCGCRCVIMALSCCFEVLGWFRSWN